MALLGVASLVSFIAVLSVNLGLINLFPIPILDGGHLLFYFFEAIRGRPLPPRAQDIGFRAGMALLACAVRVRHLERSKPFRPVPLGRRPDGLGCVREGPAFGAALRPTLMQARRPIGLGPGRVPRYRTPGYGPTAC